MDITVNEASTSRIWHKSHNRITINENEEKKTTTTKNHIVIAFWYMYKNAGEWRDNEGSVRKKMTHSRCALAIFATYFLSIFYHFLS